MLTRNKKKTIKAIKTVIILLIFFVIYLILGATLPFINQKEVSDAAKKTLDVNSFYGDGVSVDRAAVVEDSDVLIDDNISIIGSYNFDMRSVYLDTETMLVVHGEEFNKELENVMNVMKDQSYEVLSNGEYVDGDDVVLPELPWWKKIAFRVTSVVFQIIRYLL